MDAGREGVLFALSQTLGSPGGALADVWRRQPLMANDLPADLAWLVPKL